ncbi:MAG: hypothetical protein LBB78_03520 [Spirochaetaceae bacterium]|jgi:hypothetical protein|nr:hypothetical protein [Spirochaetaceae bacterium]
MLKKSLFLGAAALAVLLILAGCSNPASEGETVYLTGVDGRVVSKAELGEVLANKTPGTYALLSDKIVGDNNTDAILGTTGYTLIPEGITLNLYGGFTITTGALTVGGTLNITEGSTLTANATTVNLIIGYAEKANEAKGTVTVKKGGKLAVDAFGAIKFANTVAAEGSSGTAVALTDLMVLGYSSTGSIAGHDPHGEAPGAQLFFEDGSLLWNTTALSVTDAAQLKKYANAVFAMNLSVNITTVEDLTIRAGTVVTTVTGALGPTGTLTVNGTLTSASGAAIGPGLTKVVVGPKGKIDATTSTNTFAAVTDLVVDGTFITGASTFAALTNASGSGIVTVGAVPDAATDSKAVLLVESPIKTLSIASTALTTADDTPLTIPAGTKRTFTAAVTPSGDVVVNGDLTIGGTGSIQLKDGKELSVAGSVTAATSGVIKLAETAKLSTAGTGKIVAGLTTFDGDGTWTVTATGGAAEANVSGASITSAAAGATIALVAGTGTRTGIVLAAAGAGPRITQAAGSGSKLTLTSATLDLAEAGSLTLKGAVTNPGTLTLTGSATAGVIKTGTSTGGSGITSVAKIAGAAITALTIGSSSGEITAVYAAADSDGNIKLASITPGHATGPDITPSGADDVTFVKDVVIN